MSRPPRPPSLLSLHGRGNGQERLRRRPPPHRASRDPPVPSLSSCPHLASRCRDCGPRPRPAWRHRDRGPPGRRAFPASLPGQEVAPYPPRADLEGIAEVLEGERRRVVVRVQPITHVREHLTSLRILRRRVLPEAVDSVPEHREHEPCFRPGHTETGEALLRQEDVRREERPFVGGGSGRAALARGAPERRGTLPAQRTRESSRSTRSRSMIESQTG
jgi:hypothetical protein